MALFVDLAALSNGLHGSVQMDSVALFLWIGWLRHHGILKVGKQADLVCLNENPLENISNVRKINRVIQSGKIVVENN